jgi:8-oxo-dGTP diphosphatase
MAEQELDPFGRPYPPKQGGYHVPFLATDAIVTRTSAEGHLEVLMITRAHEPDVGKYALPGGHLEYGEDPKSSCLRELEEECGITGSNP